MGKFIQLLIAAICIILHFIGSFFLGLIPAKILSLLGFKGTAESLLRINGHLLAKGIVFFLGGTVHVTGLENLHIPDKCICFVSNHQSYTDIPLIVSYIPLFLGFVAKIELKKVPILNGWISALGCVYIDRSSARSSVKAVLDGVKTLKSGHPLVIFSEGTRSKCNGFGKFKPGSLKLATRAKAVIFPITIQNTYKLLEGRKDKKKLRTPIYLTIHPPIPTEGLSEKELKSLPEKVFSTIKSKTI